MEGEPKDECIGMEGGGVGALVELFEYERFREEKELSRDDEA